MKTSIKTIKRQTRKNRIRARVSGTEDRPRLSVFKSNTEISVQIIDDKKGLTLASVSSKKAKGSKAEKAVFVGKEIAKVANEKGIKKVVFDRSGYIYTGKIKALADAAREAGLEF